jgi:hypothetical protein
MNVIVLNRGSSTLKFQIVATDLGRIKQNTDERLGRGQVEHSAEKQSSPFRRAMESGRSSRLRFTIFRQRWSTWFVGSSRKNRESPKRSLRPISMLTSGRFAEDISRR